MSWSEEEALHLISAYEAQKLLCYLRHPDHLKKNKKIDAWAKISAKLGRNPDQCKNKIVNLLSSSVPD